MLLIYYSFCTLLFYLSLTGSSKVSLLKGRDELPVYLSEARQFGGSIQQAAY